MNRSSWKFTYTADKLLGAAISKHDWHCSRRNWWETKRDEIKKKIQNEGIVIDESVAALDAGHSHSYSNNFTGRGTSVSIDNGLIKDLNECLAKVTEHQSKTKDYHAWIQVLESQGAASFDLNQDDWLFFFGK